MPNPKELLARYQPREAHVLRLDSQVRSLRLSPCGRLLAAGDCLGRIRRWQTDDWAELPPLAGHHAWVDNLDFAPGGERLFSADSWGQLRCCDYLGDHPALRWQAEQAHDGWVRGLAVSPDGKLVATCGNDQQVALWSAAKGTLRHKLAAHRVDVYSVCFHPDGRRLYSGDFKGQVIEWDAQRGKQLRRLDAGALFTVSKIQEVGGIRTLAVSPDGATLACGGTEPTQGSNVRGIPTVLLFDLQTGKQTQRLQYGKVNDVFVCQLAFHPDGFFALVTSGQPKQGKFAYHFPGDAQPFFETTELPNCHALAIDAPRRRMAVAATQRVAVAGETALDENGNYQDNSSPIHLFELPDPNAAV